MNEVLKLSEDGKKLLWADKSITNVTIPKGVKIIGEDSFNSSLITSVVIPESVEEIGFGAFRNCHKLTSVQLPYSLKKIGEQAFAATGLASLQIPEGVTEIGGAAFFNSRSLRSIIIPSTMEIMMNPFVAVELHEAYIYITDLDRIKFGGHLKCKYLYVPSGKIEAYKQHPVFGKVEHIIEMNQETYN